MNRLLTELTEDERKLYDIGFDAGKQDGIIKGFAVGIAFGSICIAFLTAMLT